MEEVPPTTTSARIMEASRRNPVQYSRPAMAWRYSPGHSLCTSFAVLLFSVANFGVVFVSAQVRSLTDANTLACYACMPPFSGDQVSRIAANDVRSNRYKLFKDLSGIQTCDTFSATGAPFQRACTTTERDKTVVCTSITNGIWVARSCETIFADDTPKCTLKDGIRSCQCDTYLCNESGAKTVRPDNRLITFILATILVATGFAMHGSFIDIFP